MNKVNLHYATIELAGDIPMYKLNVGSELMGFILAESDPDAIYLVSVFDEVYVTQHIARVCHWIEMIGIDNKAPFIAEINVHIQEYESFEDAYAVALDMMEEHPQCYSNQNNLY